MYTSALKEMGSTPTEEKFFSDTASFRRSILVKLVVYTTDTGCYVPRIFHAIFIMSLI